MLNLTEKNDLLNRIVSTSGIHPTRIFNIYLFGSRVYGTANRDSDWDAIMIAKNSVESTEIRKGLFNIHVYTPDKFKEDLENHRINNLECIYAPDWAKLKEDIKFDNFKIDKNKLRHMISQISSNSWVKCAKKLEQENEYYIGVKSLFHSIRIPMFGSQIAEYGKIVDFSCANWIWDVIKSNHWTWASLYKRFKPIINDELSKFRILSPKKLK
jgi:predicted nucleotidyltransferase